MSTVTDYRPVGCRECLNSQLLDFDFSMAFQPIVRPATQEVFAYEALVRGLNGEPAGEVFSHVNDSNLYRFDQTCRVKAVKLASDLAIPCHLSINFMPNAVYRPELCIRTTLAAADEYHFPIERMIFEITESEQVRDIPHMRNIVEHYQSRGFKTAIDDFGAGFAGLNLLADVATDIVKIDMALIRDIDTDETRQAILRGVLRTCQDLNRTPIAEGIETIGEYETLRSIGIELFQGFLFAKPGFETLPAIHWPD